MDGRARLNLLLGIAKKTTKDPESFAILQESGRADGVWLADQSAPLIRQNLGSAAVEAAVETTLEQFLADRVASIRAIGAAETDIAGYTAAVVIALAARWEELCAALKEAESVSAH